MIEVINEFLGGQFALSAHTPRSAAPPPHCGVTAAIAAAVRVFNKVRVFKIKIPYFCNMNPEFYKNQAALKQKEHIKFLDNLKKKPPKNLDYLVQETHDEVFERIDCLQCANCCKTTGPLFTEKDIERISKHLRMKQGDFETKYLKTDEDSDKVLQNLPCWFLNTDNTCSIYEVRPKACREFPHTDRKKIYQINHLTIKNTLICPAAFEFVERLQKNIIKK